jgi:hypothetical protein
MKFIATTPEGNKLVEMTTDEHDAMIQEQQLTLEDN